MSFISPSHCLCLGHHTLQAWWFWVQLTPSSWALDTFKQEKRFINQQCSGSCRPNENHRGVDLNWATDDCVETIAAISMSGQLEARTALYHLPSTPSSNSRNGSCAK